MRHIFWTGQYAGQVVIIGIPFQTEATRCINALIFSPREFILLYSNFGFKYLAVPLFLCRIYFKPRILSFDKALSRSSSVIKCLFNINSLIDFFESNDSL